MHCPNCGQQSILTAKYCTRCGTALYPDLETNTGQPENRPSDLSDIQSEVLQIRATLNSLNNRLTSLEQVISRNAAEKPTIESLPPDPQQTPEVKLWGKSVYIPEIKIKAEPEVEPEVRPEIKPEVKPAAQIPVQSIPGSEAVTHIEAVKQPEPEPPAVQLSPAPVMVTAKSNRQPPKNREWEQILGGNWLARIGVLALIIGAAFFLKYAFDREWLGPTARIVLGVGAGLVLLVLGYLWNKKYPIFAQALSGGGIALLYLCIFAAFAVFSLIGFYWAIFLLVIISAISTFLAVRYNSMAMAILGIVGAFAAPFIIGASYKVSNNGLPLMIYIILVDICVLALSTFRNWRWFNLLALAATMGSYGIWYHQFGHHSSLLTAELGLTVLFLIFFGATILYSFIRKHPAEVFDYVLMGLNAVSYFVVSQILMWNELRAWMGGFSLLVALLFGGLAYYSLKKDVQDRRMGYFALGIGLVFLTAAVHIHFGDEGWSTIGWAIEGLIAFWISVKFQSRYFRFIGYGVFGLMIIRLLCFDAIVPFRLAPVFNMRVLAFLFGIAATYLAGFLIWRKQLMWHYPLIIASNLLALVIVAVETIQFVTGHTVHDAGAFTVIFLLVIAAWLAWQTIFMRGDSAIFNCYLWIINFVFFLAISVPLWDEFRAWMGLIYLFLAIIFGVQIYLFRTDRIMDFNKPAGMIGLGIPIAFLTLAVPGQFGNHVWTTIGWAIEGLIAVWISVKFKSGYFRFIGYGVFVLMIIRLLGFDTPVSSRQFVPVFNMRVLAFLFGIAATYLAGYLVWLKKLPLHQPFIIISNFLALWIAAVETIQFITGRPAHDSGAFTVIFLLVVAVWLAWQNIFMRRNFALFKCCLWIINFVFFLGISVPLWHEFRAWMGLLYFIMAIIFGVQIYLFHRDQIIKINNSTGAIGLGIPLIFLTLAVPGQFGNHAWATVGWAIEMVLVTWLAFTWRISNLRVYAYILFVLTAGRLIIFDTFDVLKPLAEEGIYTPVLNERVLAFLVSIIAIYIVAYLIWRNREQDPEWKIPVSTFLIAASAFTIWVLSFEFWNYFDLQLAMLGKASSHSETVKALHSAQKVSLTAVWAVYAVIVLIVGISRRVRAARLWALGLLAVAIIKVFVYDVFVLEQVYRIIAFTGLGVLLIISGYLYHRYSRKIKEFLISKDE